MEVECRSYSLAMVNIIVPNVMSFLTDDNGSNCVVDEWSAGDDGDGRYEDEG